MVGQAREEAPSTVIISWYSQRDYTERSDKMAQKAMEEREHKGRFSRYQYSDFYITTGEEPWY